MDQIYGYGCLLFYWELNSRLRLLLSQSCSYLFQNHKFSHFPVETVSASFFNMRCIWQQKMCFFWLWKWFTQGTGTVFVVHKTGVALPCSCTCTTLWQTSCGPNVTPTGLNYYLQLFTLIHTRHNLLAACLYPTGGKLSLELIFVAASLNWNSVF